MRFRDLKGQRAGGLPSLGVKECFLEGFILALSPTGQGGLENL